MHLVTIYAIHLQLKQLFFSCSRCVDAQRIVYPEQSLIGGHIFSHMQGRAIDSLVDAGDSAVSVETLAERIPTIIDSRSAQMFANGLNQLIGHHGDEHMALGPLGDPVEDGT